MASCWWIWLICLLLCASFGVYKWITGLFKTVGSIMKVSVLTLKGVEIVTDSNKTTSEKAKVAQDEILAKAAAEGKARLFDWSVNILALILTIVFSILLLISIGMMFL
jgi:hypothetical protein